MSKRLCFPITFLLVALIISATSCTKNDSGAEQVFYRVDTIFYEPLDLTSFFVSPGFGTPEPISVKGFTYFLATEDSFLNDGDILYKVDDSTGEIVWRWSQYLTNGGRAANSLSLHSGKVCLNDFNHVYILDAETGSHIYTYTPPANHNIGGSAVYLNKLYVSLTNIRQVSLVEMNVDGSGEKTIHTTNGIAKGIKLHEGQDFFHISYAVATGDSYSGNGSVFYALSLENLRFQELAAGRLPLADNPLYLADKMRMFSLSEDYLLSGFNLNHFYPLKWSRVVKGRHLYQNENNLYIADPDIQIVNKESGDVLAYLPHKGGQLAVNNHVMIRKEAGLRLCDPTSGEVLQTLNTRGHITIFHIRNDEFFFGENITNGQSRVGKLRITRIR